MNYSKLDKFKLFSLKHRYLVVAIMTIFILSIFGIGTTYSLKNKINSKNNEFDEIQSLIDKIEKHDSNIMNNIEVVEETKTVNGIDVSGWQGNVDWNQIKESGVDFVMLRVGSRKLISGEIVEDSFFKKNASACNKLGIPIGVYFYSAAITELEVLEEAIFVLNIIKDYKITYPVAYDLEDFGEFRLAKTSDERFNYNALVFLNYFKSHGYNGMLYANKSALETHWDLSRYEGYKIWLAHYIGSTSYDGPYDMWQYSDMGNINGITGNVDLNMAKFAYREKNELGY